MVNAQDVMNAMNARLPVVVDVFSGAQEGYNPLDFYNAHKRIEESGKIRRVDSESARAKLAAIFGGQSGLEGIFSDDVESVKRDFEKRGKEKLETYALASVPNLLGEIGVGDQTNPEPGNRAMMRLIFNTVKPEAMGALVLPPREDEGENAVVQAYNNVVQTVAVANQRLELIKRDPAGYVNQRIAAFTDQGVQDYYRASPDLLESLARNGERRVRKVGEMAVTEYSAPAFITNTLGRLASIKTQVREANDALDEMVDGPERYAASQSVEGLRTAEYHIGSMLKGLMGDASEKIAYKIAQAQAAQAAQQAAGGKGKKK
ncbi:MAG: hypothetical protein WCP89_04480 [archaeon]